MAMIDMLFEAAAGSSFWAPTTYDSALVFRPLQTAPTPVGFQLDPALIGLLLQLRASVFLSWLFPLYVASRLPPPMLIVAGAAYGAVIFMVISLLVLPVVNPVMFRLNGAAFRLAHVLWAASLGALLKRAYTTAGSQPLAPSPAPFLPATVSSA